MDATLLIRGMGRKPSSLISACTNSVASVRAQLAQVHRRLTLAPLLTAPSFRASAADLSVDFLGYVFEPTDLPSFPGFAQMTQNAGFLIAFITENPRPFAAAVLTRGKSASFQYLVNCAIPSVFGHFISAEHFSIAVQFYAAVIESAPAHHAVSILAPLFRSAATFRFLEAAFSEFVRWLIVQINLSPPNTGANLIPMYAARLVELVVGAAPLLPQAILDLIRLARRSNWPQNKFTQFLLDAFLWPNALRWMQNSSSPAHAGYLRRVIDHIAVSPSDVSAICDGIARRDSITLIPELYTCFNQHFLEISLSVHDIHVLAKTLLAAKMIPETVALAELNRPSAELEFSIFSCQVCPRGPRLPPRPPSPRIFAGTAAEVEVFERLLAYTQHQREILKWLDVLQSHENGVVEPIISNLTAQPSPAPFLQQFWALRTRLNVIRLSRRIYLGLLDSRLAARVVQGLSNVLVVADAEFKRVLRESPDGAPQFPELMASLRPPVQPFLAEAVHRLACLDSANLHERLRILLQSIHMLMQIQKLEDKTDVIYPLTFQHNKGRKFLSTFLILNNFAMKEGLFNELCTDLEKRIWVKLESAVLLVLKADPQFLEAYISLQEQLTEIAVAELE
jgi:hypothetical protein